MEKFRRDAKITTRNFICNRRYISTSIIRNIQTRLFSPYLPSSVSSRLLGIIKTR